MRKTRAVQQCEKKNNGERRYRRSSALLRARGQNMLTNIKTNDFARTKDFVADVQDSPFTTDSA